MLASSACAVQMFDVAFSRRMCCSRVCSAIRYARVAVRVDRHADDAARRLPHVLLARREERRVRAAVAERHAEALRVADDDVGAHLAGRREQRQAQQIGADRDQHAGRVRARDEVAQIVHAPGFVRRLHAARRTRVGRTRHVSDVADRRARCRAARRARAARRSSAESSESATKNCARAGRRRSASPARGAASSSLRPRRSPRRAATRSRPPSRSDRVTIVWKLSSDFEAALRDLRLIRRVGVYQPGFSRTLRRMTLGVMQS